ncbi:DUF6221 family protein [Nocardia sp. NPDC005825]|uniref:DUF6221 family protein n=1 Tax=Nocardia sp. NPDC005825 TaxID=3155452 RepID=UPI0033F6E5B9
MMTIEQFIDRRLEQQQEAAEFALQLEHDFRDSGREIEYQWVRLVRPKHSRTAPSAVFVPGVLTPKQTLRHVAVLRLIFGEHAPDEHHRCSVCRVADASSDDGTVAWPCPTVREMAALWSDHRDYRAEWAIDRR